MESVSSRLAHFPENFTVDTGGETGIVEGGDAVEGVCVPTRRPTLALTADGPRRADLIAWAGAHRTVLGGLRLLAPAGIKVLLHDHLGLEAEVLKSGTVGPTATAGLSAAGDIDAMVAFSDPIELRPGDNTTRSLTRLAVFWDIPIAGNRATADLLLATVTVVGPRPADLAAPTIAESEPAGGAVKLWAVRATVDDVPGRLAILAASLARRAINILSVQVHLTPEGPVDELLVAASPVLSAGELSAAIVDGGARAPRVVAADAHALIDAPTRALALATRLVRKPDDLAQVLLSLLPGAQITWRAEPPPGHADTSFQMWLDDSAGGGFLLVRPDVPFTPAESARAYAMMDVATVASVALTRRADVPAAVDSGRLLLTDGSELTVRRGTAADAQAILDLHAHCRMTARLRRYLVGADRPAVEILARVLDPDACLCLVVEDADGRLVAMANLMDADAELPELALLVHEAWRGRRIGSALARRLVSNAQAAGVPSVRGVVHASDVPMVKIMTALGYRIHREFDGGMLTLIASLQQPGYTQRFPKSIRLSQSA